METGVQKGDGEQVREGQYDWKSNVPTRFQVTDSTKGTFGKHRKVVTLEYFLNFLQEVLYSGQWTSTRLVSHTTRLHRLCRV